MIVTKPTDEAVVLVINNEESMLERASHRVEELNTLTAGWMRLAHLFEPFYKGASAGAKKERRHASRPGDRQENRIRSWRNDKHKQPARPRGDFYFKVTDQGR